MLKWTDGSLPSRPDRSSPSPAQHPGGRLQTGRERDRIWRPTGAAVGLSLGDQAITNARGHGARDRERRWRKPATSVGPTIVRAATRPVGRRRVTPRTVLGFGSSRTAGLRLTDTSLAGRNSVQAKRGFRLAGIGKRLKSRSDVQSSDIPCDEQISSSLMPQQRATPSPRGGHT